MKECKNSGILPCYRDGYGVWHYSDDTHDKVYELNRQMCDIDKHLSEAGYFRMICDGQIETRKKLIDMEEKKTKKMTKAEAFEYLKGKKVKCYKVGEHYGEELLKKLAECGCTSNIFLPKGILSVWAIFISDVCDLSILDTAHADQYGNYDLCEISAEDILSIEIVEEVKEPLDKWEEFASKVAKIQETLDDDEVCIITKTNFLTMTK